MYLQRIFILLIATVALLFVSCSKKQIPVSSKKYNAAIASAEMQAFAKGGVERDLKTGRKKPKKIIKTAEKYLGTPHCMGGTSKKCLDCSGLTYISFAKNKIEIPRNSQEQARYGRYLSGQRHVYSYFLVGWRNQNSLKQFVVERAICLWDKGFLRVFYWRLIIFSTFIR